MQSPNNQPAPMEDELDVRFPVGRAPTPPVRPVSREATAATIASVIVWTFMGSISACFLVVFIELCFALIKTNGTLDSQSLTTSFELFKTVSAIMSGPLGFVLGFYFRDKGQD